jgi:hypothetical protein
MSFAFKWRLLPYLKENDSIIPRHKKTYTMSLNLGEKSWVAANVIARGFIKANVK